MRNARVAFPAPARCEHQVSATRTRGVVAHMYNDGAGGSLQQSLLSAARRWESEKQLSESRLRNQAEKANARANDLEKKLQSERVRIAELEQLVKEEANRATVQTQRADDLEKQVTASRLQTLGSFLLLGDVRGKLKGLSRVRHRPATPRCRMARPRRNKSRRPRMRLPPRRPSRPSRCSPTRTTMRAA